MTTPPGFIQVGTLLEEAEEAVTWVVDGLLPAGGLSLVVGKPKSGKSTLARVLACAVATGASVCNRRTAAGPVLYLALEDKRADVRRHMGQLGVAAETPLLLHVGPPPASPLPWLAAAIDATQPRLVVLDPLGRFLRTRDVRDYSEITRLTEPVIQLAHRSGAHVHATHHAPKLGGGDTIDAPLGSTALAGAIDTLLVLRRYPDGVRTLESIQRSGDDLPETVLAFDAHGGTVGLYGTLDAHRHAVVMARIVAVLGSGALTEAEIRERVGTDNRVVGTALRDALRDGLVGRRGTGHKGQPFIYYLVERESSGSEEATKRESGNQDSRCSLTCLGHGAESTGPSAPSSEAQPGGDGVTVEDVEDLFPGARRVRL